MRKLGWIGWIREKELPNQYLGMKWLYYMISILNVISYRHTLVYIAYFFAAIAGVFYSHYWFASHLFQVVIRSTQLKSIVRALWITSIPLLLIAALMFQFVYIFSVISYIFFPDQYDPGSRHCSSLAQCTATNIYFGIPSNGGLFEFLTVYNINPNDQGITGHGVAWILYQGCFFICIGVILLNLVVATIVDTFGQLRQKRKEAKQSLGSVCFICSLERDAFQQKAKDFTTHVETEHNPLHYFYFFAYLKDMLGGHTRSQLSGLEEELIEKIWERRFLKFFPVGRASALEGEEEEDKFNEKLDSQFDRLSQSIEQTSQQQEKLFKQTNDTNRHLQQLTEQFKDMTADLKFIKRTIN